MPPTEVPIERDFSNLNHIFRNRRIWLQSARLTDNMIMHLNKGVFYDVENEELREEIQKHQTNDKK